MIEAGGRIVQETRLFNPDTGETRTMRTKEDANDYRYFPDPDLLPVVCRARESSTRSARRCRSCPRPSATASSRSTGCRSTTPTVLTGERALADYYEAVVKASGADAKLCANWVTTDLLGALNKLGKDIATSPITAQAARRPAHAHRRQDHLRQDRQGRVRGDARGRGRRRRPSSRRKGLVQITDERRSSRRSTR